MNLSKHMTFVFTIISVWNKVIQHTHHHVTQSLLMLWSLELGWLVAEVCWCDSISMPYTSELNSEHAQKVAELEQALQQKLRERQKVYEEAFNQDMEQYLSTGYLQHRGKSLLFIAYYFGLLYLSAQNIFQDFSLNSSLVFSAEMCTISSVLVSVGSLFHNSGARTVEWYSSPFVIRNKQVRAVSCHKPL